MSEYLVEKINRTMEDANKDLNATGKCYCIWGLCNGRDHLPNPETGYHTKCAEAQWRRWQEYRENSFEAQEERNFQKLASHWLHD